MKQQLRVVAEAAVLGTVAWSLPAFGPLAWVPVFNFFGAWGINLGFLDGLVGFLGMVFPFVAAFYYGLRRALQLHFLAVWIGWVIGVLGYGAVLQFTLLRHIKEVPQKSAAGSPWVNWLVWLGAMLLSTLVPALSTMWGQRLRVRIAQRLGAR